jgi:glucose-1-phosphate cytidylyltransferase
MRLRGYADDVPKPMVTIGTRPIIWHLMKYYAHFGHKDFILCLGYKGSVIKDYFLHYDESVSNDFVLSHGARKVTYLHRDIDDWTITFVHTGANALIGERLKIVEPYLEGEEIFLANYSDGLTDLPLPNMIGEFEKSNAIGSMLLVQPTSSLDMVRVSEDGLVQEVREMSTTDIWINGGFFVLRKDIFRNIRPGEELVYEPFQRLIQQGTLKGYRYRGFWRCMDTFKDKQHLEELEIKKAPWKVWNQEAAKKQVVVAFDNERRSVDVRAGARNTGIERQATMGSIYVDSNATDDFQLAELGCDLERSTRTATPGIRRPSGS